MRDLRSHVRALPPNQRTMGAVRTAMLLVGGVLLSGCPNGSEPADADLDIEDSTVDAPRGDTADVEDSAGGCTHPADCGGDQVCVEGDCRSAPDCSGPEDWQRCVREINQMTSGLGTRAYCDGSRCRVGCTLDRHCGSGQFCTDFGACRTDRAQLDAPEPGGDETSKLRAGVGRRLLDVPIGLSLAGYGSRAATDDGRYVESLRASHGAMHGLYARALALDNGRRRLLLVRLPIIFATSALHEAVARRLQRQTGRNWRGSLLLGATHTHSGPARFYHLPERTFGPVASLGTDTFHDQVFEWLVASTTTAARRALDDLTPARLGTDIVEGFDTDDAIARDRRTETPTFDDNRLFVARVDDASGSPRAVVVSLGIHGTIHSDDYFNGDAVAGLERGLERALARKYGRPVPVLFLNQNGGTMSPAGADRGHAGPQRMQRLGRIFARRAMSHVDSIPTRRDVELDGTTHRFPITYRLVGYERGEWGPPATDLEGPTFHHGAFQCLGEGDDDFSTYTSVDQLTCFPVQRLLYHRPPSLFLRSQISAFRLGDSRLVTAPGELSMELGWRMLRTLRDRTDLEPDSTWTVGFAQDHQFYLLPDRLREEEVPFSGFRGTEPSDAPDRAFSYLQGGYEADMSFWGWKFGDYLVDRAVDTVAHLQSDDPPRHLPETAPTHYSDYGHSDFPVETSDADRIGATVVAPPTNVERFESVEYAWVGGDPGAERPQTPRVALQRKNGGDFETIRTDRLQPYTNREPVMLTRLRREGDDWVWIVRWEEGRALPSGTYRFAVSGSFATDDGTRDYTTRSRPFSLTPTDDLAVSGSISNATLEATVGYPAGSRLDYDGSDSDPGAVDGNFRLRDARVPTGIPAPLEPNEELAVSDVTVQFRHDGGTVASVSPSEISLRIASRNRGGVAAVPETVLEAPVPSTLSSETSYDVRIHIEDDYGNTGMTSLTYTPSN